MADAAIQELRAPLKWLGGKSWLVPRLRELYAPHRHRRLVELFVGGMNVALGLQPKHALLNDANKHLVNFYVRLRFGRPFTVAMENDEALYYKQREAFNALIDLPGGAYSPDAGELFYYLNRTCFNGVCRFNKSGKFNVPFGKYKTINYRRDFSEYVPVMRGWELRIGDFDQVNLDCDDFVFADPPYDDTFVDYSQDGFAWADQVRLADKLARHAGPVVATNSSTDRILELHASRGFKVDKVPAPRSVAANGDRKQVEEMLATKNL